jgi:hypothetical protein
MKGKGLMIVAGIALASGAMSAHAAKPMTVAEKKAAAEAVAQNHKRFNVTPPKTMAQANGTLRQTATGGNAISVPTDLWNTLAVEKAADGSVRIVETDGTATAGAKQEGLPNE